MNKRRKSGNSTNERKGRGGNNSKKSHGKKVYKEVEGTLKMSRDGSAFLIVEGREDDIYIRAAKTRGALNGDKVKVAIKKTASAPGKHAEGDVIAVIERSTKPFIGVLHIVGNQAWVLMQSKFMPYDISIEVKDKDDKSCKGALRRLGHNEYAVTGVYETVDGKKKELQAHLGMKVAAVVDDWPRGANNPVGHLVDVLGELGENDTEMHAILAEYGLPYRFEPEVENAADKISEEITAKDIKERRDFRDTLTFTIDPADAKDFDDALSFRRLANGNYEVGVHIADVSHYVTPGTPVDKEAQSRGTSVYLVDRTVPMLPEKLCNKLCSLRPNEEKLTFSAVFEISPSGKVFNQWIGRTVIKSDHRFNYDQAQDIIEDKESPVSQELKDAVKTLWDLASIFRKRRFAAGAISFERPEMKVEVDEKGKPIAVHQHISKEANWLIEEFMLLANRTVAEFIATAGKMDGKARKNAKTFVYRIHDEPNLEKLQSLRKFAGNFGYKTTVGEGDGNKIARDLNGLLDEAKDKPEFMALEMIALRSMAKACYSTDNIGHYGLAFRFYTHFTSPIRRYPDTMVHRLLAMYLNGADSQNKDYYEQQCVHASEREVIAANAERDSIKYKLVEFMQDKIDQEFDGNISGLTDWGMYVEIDPTKIEGMVALRDIKSDFFEFDEDNYRIRGRRTGKIYHLGDPVRIRVKATNLEQRILDYELIETGIDTAPVPPAGKKRVPRKKRTSSAK
ncbi:MAG: ribonuclease R [Bacteroidales bacterium]|nr:ribonuclease R [Bacteroidales bacterium]